MNGMPFIHLFKNRMGYFFFDVNMNRIVEVDEDTFYLLDECLKSNDISKIFNNNSLRNLMRKGYLLDKHAKNIKNPLTEYIPDYLSKYLKNLVLQVTQNCNMRCRYCIYSGNGDLSRKHDSRVMSWEVAKVAIDFLRKNSLLSRKIEIGFYGGEPLLGFALIKKCVNYCEKIFYDKELIFSITTNGTIINNEIIDFFAEHNFQVMISVDGPKDIHNINRRLASNGSGTYEIIYENLKKIRERNYNFYKNITINGVLEPDQDNSVVEKFFEEEELFKELHIMLNRVADTYIDTNYADTNEHICTIETLMFKNIMSKITNNEFCVFSSKEKKFDMMSTEFVDLGPLPDDIHHGGGCMPGYSKMFVDVDGVIRPCEKVSENSKHMIIGNVYQGFDFENVKKLLNIGLITKQECLNCWIIRHCRQCPSIIDDVDCLSYEQKKNVCSYQIADMKEQLNDYVYYRKLGLI